MNGLVELVTGGMLFDLFDYAVLIVFIPCLPLAGRNSLQGGDIVGEE